MPVSVIVRPRYVQNAGTWPHESAVRRAVDNGPQQVRDSRKRYGQALFQDADLDGRLHRSCWRRHRLFLHRRPAWPGRRGLKPEQQSPTLSIHLCLDGLGVLLRGISGAHNRLPFGPFWVATEGCSVVIRDLESLKRETESAGERGGPLAPL
jgi:hypothetical protein